MSMFACLDSDNDEPVKPKVAAPAKDAAPKGNAPAKAAAPAKNGSSGTAAKPAGSAAPKAAVAGGDKPKPKGTAIRDYWTMQPGQPILFDTFHRDFCRRPN